MTTALTANSRCVNYGNVEAENAIYYALDSFSLSSVKDIWVSAKEGDSCIITAGQVFASQQLFEQMLAVGWKIRAIEPIRKGTLNLYFDKVTGGSD